MLLLDSPFDLGSLSSVGHWERRMENVLHVVSANKQMLVPASCNHRYNAVQYLFFYITDRAAVGIVQRRNIYEKKS